MGVDRSELRSARRRLRERRGTRRKPFAPFKQRVCRYGSAGCCRSSKRDVPHPPPPGGHGHRRVRVLAHSLAYSARPGR